MIEPPVRIENRTQLVYLLSEAAELEHGISCCYLYAGFSMKDSTGEGLSEAQLEAVRSWKATIMEVAVQEMLHLALVNNLLTAIGAAPHIRRPNLPTSPSMYPQTIELGLRPFTQETLEGFIFLERPESVMTSLEAGQRPPMPPPVRTRDIFFDRPEYETIGHLYRGMEDGFRYLTEKYGESRLFVGSPGAQASEYPRLTDLLPVSDLATAIEAIQRIVEQGEGSPGESESGHYARFQGIHRELIALKERDPSFEPARPVLVNAYTHVPADMLDPGKIGLVGDPLSVVCCNLFDALYEMLIQMLGRLFARVHESAEEIKLLADMTVGLMSRALGPLGESITTLPAGPRHPGLRAGPSFYVPRNIHTPPQRRATWISWVERLKELSAFCALIETFEGAPGVLPRVGQLLTRYASRAAEVADRE
jgi:hypothetical protein